MKILLLLFLSLSTFASSIKLKTNIDNNLVDGLIEPLWQTIPYLYRFDKQQNIVSNEISYSIEEGKLLLAPSKAPLFNIKVLDDKNIELDWNLNHATADVLIKMRFKFKQFGIQITHDEYFKADLSHIKAAYSKLEVLSGSQLQLRHLDSKNFSFETVSVVARDGIGSTLRYILDNILSKREIDKLIKKAINTYMQEWINNSHIIKTAEQEINQSIHDHLARKRQLPNLASTISFNLDAIEYSKSQLALIVSPKFHEVYKTHACAQEINDKGEIDISRSIFEKILDNLTINEVLIDSKIKEPILCLGYKEGHDGEDVSVLFLNRKVDFKLWMRPNEKIKYSYNQNIIQIKLNLTSEIHTQSYPHIYVVGNNLTSKSTMEFKLILTKKGLVLNFLSLKVNSITGRAHVKWSRFLPKVRLPLNIIGKKLENELSKSLKDQFNDFILLENDLEINSKYKVQFKTYSNDHSFNVGFDIKAL